ncbi:response regulator [bacterium]|nr:response regulator [bacterium]MBU1990395.1 response regulator [bacterium]
MGSLKELKQLCSSLSVLYVEDDAQLQAMVSDYLKNIFAKVVSANDGLLGLENFKKNQFDLVITDIKMPNMDGIEMIRAIKKESPDQEVIILTAFSESDYLMDAIKLDISGYLLKPVDFNSMNSTLFRVVEKIIALRQNREYKLHLEEMVKEELQKNSELESEKIDNYEQTLIALVELIERRDTYTGGHSQRVATYCKAIAEHMKCTLEQCDLIYRAGILHDIGKVVTPDAILLKPGNLDENEYKLIQGHVTAGTQMLAKIPMYKELVTIILSHHERYDGNGYPQGLQGEEIPFLSRIMIIADAFDAMTTNRIYKPRLSVEAALQEIAINSAKQFDPEIVPFALEALNSINTNSKTTQLPKGEIEQERFAYFYKDQITGLYNQEYLDLILNQNANSKIYNYISLISLHNFTHFNQNHSWKEGDKLLKRVALCLSKSFKDVILFRFQGDDFILLSSKKTTSDISKIKEILSEADPMLNATVKDINILEKQIFSLSEFEKNIKV